MHELFIRVKSVVHQDDKYLVLKHWIDDRIVDPYVWEFIDTELEKGESVEQAILRGIHDAVGVDGEIERPLYTWSQMIGDIQCIGVTYLCQLADSNASLMMNEEYCGYEWIESNELQSYIENKKVLNDILRTIGEQFND